MQTSRCSSCQGRSSLTARWSPLRSPCRFQRQYAYVTQDLSPCRAFAPGIRSARHRSQNRHIGKTHVFDATYATRRQLCEKRNQHTHDQTERSRAENQQWPVGKRRLGWRSRTAEQSKAAVECLSLLLKINRSCGRLLI